MLDIYGVGRVPSPLVNDTRSYISSAHRFETLLGKERCVGCGLTQPQAGNGACSGWFDAYLARRSERTTSGGRHADCPTCICDRPDTLDAFNRRCASLASEIAIELRGALWPAVRERLSPHPHYSFGFTGWKVSWSSDVVCGQFLASLFPVPHANWLRGVDADPRYFYVNTRSPITMGLMDTSTTRYPPAPEYQPVAVEYRPGDIFAIPLSPRHFEIDEMITWPDDRLAAYLRLHLDVLVAKVVQESGEQIPGLDGRVDAPAVDS